MIRDYHKGLLLKEIAYKYGVSKNYIYNYLPKSERHIAKKIVKIDYDDICCRYLRGEEIEDIALYYRKDTWQIKKILEFKGVYDDTK